MRLLAVVKNPVSIARYLAAAGELTDVPGRSPPRAPPYWKSQVLRRQALGDQGERAASPLGGGESLASGQGGDDRTDQRAASPRGTRQRSERTGSPEFRRGCGASRTAGILALRSPSEAAPSAPACSRTTPSRRPPRAAAARIHGHTALVSLTLPATPLTTSRSEHASSVMAGSLWPHAKSSPTPAS